MSDAERFHRVAELFEAARACDAAERAAFLESACGDRPDILAEVQGLLAHHDDEDGVLAAPVVSKVMCPDVPAAERPAPPRQVGRYQVKRELGIGGMGVVYLAEQDNPRREVAIKVVRPGLVTRDLLKRFDRETALLGRLQHPGIAQIYEAGTYDDGSGARPYFAMEFVDGAPLLESVRARGLDVRERLEIFARICDAVEHAHQRGIIHRDLKPGNILVDRSGQPKILDFGVARATESDLQVSTLQTDIGQLIGTVAYMSPEQVCGRASDIDTRSDVYGLGVILYELLAERLPYDLDDRAIAAAARVISEHEPTLLSTVNRNHRGDLNTIVHKSLEKEPDHRYQSASALAADIRHYLNNEPIVARPATTMYQLRKFARRNRALVTGVVVAFVAIGAGAVAATIGMLRAQGEAARAQAMTTFLESVLIAADTARSGDVRLVDLLRDAGRSVDAEFAGHPQLGIRVHELLASAFSNIGYLEDAVRHARRWLAEAEAFHGEEHPDCRWPRVILARGLQAQMHLDEAEALTRRVVDGLDDDAEAPVAHAAWLELGHVLNLRKAYAEAEPILRRALRQAEETWGASHRATMRSRTYLAGCIDNRALHGRDEPDVRASLRAEAADLLREVVDFEKRTGEVTRDGLRAMQSLSDYERAMRRYDEAAVLAETGMDMAIARLGTDHLVVAAFERRLARALYGLGRYDEAADHIMNSVNWARDTQRDDVRTAVTMSMALPLLDAAEEWETALGYAQHLADRYGVDITKGGLGTEARIWLPYLHTRLGAPEKAGSHFDALLRDEASIDGQNRVRLHFALGIWCIERAEPDEARRHLELALGLCDDEPFTWPDRDPIIAAIALLPP